MNLSHQNKLYFPVFLDLSSKKAVVIGGGSIAQRRILTLYGFVGSITVVAPEITDGIRRLLGPEHPCEDLKMASADMCRDDQNDSQTPVTWIRKQYERSDIMDADLVLACTSDPDLNNDIYVACKCLGILVNDCSDKNKCDFYFPSVVQKDNIVVGINGSGADHHQVKTVRQKIEAALQCDHSLYQENAVHSAGRNDEDNEKA
ncbi:MAG: bifunctional precorrin-2 dehydrogenase/sirohydrochlorin ferrochelatase [Eubacterium sp.]|nr:bifunctional precorrin-2 dehydrogenase/sirohydrochlorin ferrochelatase [Eubacterium sp.]